MHACQKTRSFDSRIVVPTLLTPGAADALVMNIYRQVRTSTSPIEEVLSSALTEYQNPIASDVMDFQIRLAAREATAIQFVPAPFRGKTPS